MYGYVRNGKLLYNHVKAIDRVHVMRDGEPICGVQVHLTLTEHKNGKPVCGSCRTQMRKEAKAERLQAAVKRSQELFL